MHFRIAKSIICKKMNLTEKANILCRLHQRLYDGVSFSSGSLSLADGCTLPLGRCRGVAVLAVLKVLHASGLLGWLSDRPKLSRPGTKQKLNRYLDIDKNKKVQQTKLSVRCYLFRALYFTLAFK